MSLKQILAGSLVLATIGLGNLSFADDNGLRLSSDPAGMPSSSFSQQQPSTTGSDDISLRGHLTAVPKGTIMMIKMDQPINTSSNKVGDAVSAVVEADVYIDNQIAIPAGSQVEGMIASISPAGHLSKGGEIEIQFSAIKTTYGYNLPMRAHVVTADNTGIIKGDSSQAQVLKTLGTAAGTTAASTLMGTAAGGLLGSAGGGAMFGLAAGGIAGIGYAIVRQGKQVVIPSGARMSIVLDQPVAIN